MKFAPRRLIKTADASRGDTSWQSFLKNSLSVVIIFGLGYLALGAAAELLARTIPDRWEARMFRSSELEASGSEEFEHAEEILRRLTERDDLRRLPYRLLLVPLEAPNAFAFPGGGVGVTRGLLDSIGSDTGLAMVLGHELGHHEGRHPLKRLGRALVFTAAGALLFGRDSSSIVEASVKIAESGYSRRQEREADAFGLVLVHEIFGNTEGSLEFFEILESEHGAGEVRWASFLQSHPLTRDRIDALRQLASELKTRD